MAKILALNGPNLNLLGTREPDIYGNLTLSDIAKLINDEIKKFKLNIEIVWFQTNSEDELVKKIHSLSLSEEQYSGLIFNPGAYSHYSIAILDALKSVSVPKIEVHISNTHKREEFRNKKISAMAADGIIEGLGYQGYFLAALAISNKITAK